MLAHPLIPWFINTDRFAANGGYGSKMSPRNHSVSLAESQCHIIYPTSPASALDDGVEHRLHVGRRAADDTEHLGGCRLMLQRLTQFCVTLLQFLKEPYILNRNYSLGCESFYESDLLFSEGINFGSTNENRSNSNIFAHQWHSELGSVSFNGDRGELWKLIRGYGHRILNMDWLTLN